MANELKAFDHKQKLRMMVASVIKEASTHRLRCEEIPAEEHGSHRFRRRLLIEGRKCQIVSFRIHYVGSVYAHDEFSLIRLQRNKIFQQTARFSVVLRSHVQFANH